MRYSDRLSKMIVSAGAKEGSLISVTVDGKGHRGVLMPNKDSSDPDIIVIRLKNGYYAGFRAGKGTVIKLIEQPSVNAVAGKARKPKKGLPDIVVMGTGGTIASRADTRTGAVSPGLSAERLLDQIPESFDIANIRTRDLFSMFSENISVEQWQHIAEAVGEEMNNGADGIVILHGTDTMGYTAAALSFMLRELSGPVVLVGSQRSPDRPSSDAPGNISASVRFCASSKAAGVYVIMHDTMNDDSYAVHRGTRVRKMHTSRRDAFRSINCVPVAKMDASGSITFSDEVPKASEKTSVSKNMEKKVILLYYYPGMDPALFRDVVMGSKGVVMAGSGLGHVSGEFASLLKDAIDNGSVVVMTSQCINGPTGMNVYDTGRDLQRMGIIPAGDMLPETAYVKLMWALANSESTEEAKKMMKVRISYETNDRRTADVIW
ncbi:MAG: Glu-tRNA(Gln) amidotransferase subunit GatD [Methanomassiliicoccaceae archaeon]|jgi:glutamyl-tRNA(Gln) amidotransferase subunit D|nr:Glu-tRNA(Gln) amidotransferase subunit GatD [Methanomassiliicoccaceae archaeon]